MTFKFHSLHAYFGVAVTTDEWRLAAAWFLSLLLNVCIKKMRTSKRKCYHHNNIVVNEDEMIEKKFYVQYINSPFIYATYTQRRFSSLAHIFSPPLRPRRRRSCARSQPHAPLFQHLGAFFLLCCVCCVLSAEIKIFQISEEYFLISTMEQLSCLFAMSKANWSGIPAKISYHKVSWCIKSWRDYLYERWLWVGEKKVLILHNWIWRWTKGRKKEEKFYSHPSVSLLFFRSNIITRHSQEVQTLIHFIIVLCWVLFCSSEAAGRFQLFDKFFSLKSRVCLVGCENPERVTARVFDFVLSLFVWIQKKARKVERRRRYCCRIQ